MSPWKLNQLAVKVNQGAVFAYPTDTIWGLGCHPFQDTAVQRIVTIKQRSLSKGLILLSNRIDYCQPLIDKQIDARQLEQVATPQTRPTTWLLPTSSNCPDWLSGGRNTIAVRICTLRHISILCDRIEAPLVSTSANISGRNPARNSFQIYRQFINKVDFIVHAPTQRQRLASRIIDLQSGTIIRA